MTQRIALRVPEELYRLLEDCKNANGVTLTDVVIDAITFYLQTNHQNSLSERLNSLEERVYNLENKNK